MILVPSVYRQAFNVLRTGYNQGTNIVRWMAKLPIMVAPLVGGTIDDDDVKLAASLLLDRNSWSDDSSVVVYEDAFAQWLGFKYVSTFMSCREALSATLEAFDLEPGSEVIVSGYTCVVVSNAIRFAKLTPVYCDIELDTYGLDIDSVTARINENTKVLIIQHLYGLVCRDYDALISIARRYGLLIVEDCAQGTGARYAGLPVGRKGDVAIYSSEQSKVLNTGQGGYAATDNNKLAECLHRISREWPRPKDSFIISLLNNVSYIYDKYKNPKRWWRADLAEFRRGNNLLISTTKEETKGYRPDWYGRKMPGPVARLGLGQLRKVEAYNELRRKNARRWDLWCAVNGYKPPVVITGSEPVFLRYPILVEPERKQRIGWALRAAGVVPGVWFLSKLHPSTILVGGCPNASEAVARCINFPTLEA